MLGKMLLHGAVAAALIGSAATVYARAKDDGTPSAVSEQTARTAGQAAANGYLQPAANGQAGKVADGYLHSTADGERDHDDEDD